MSAHAPPSTRCACGCGEPLAVAAHEVLAALRRDDVDRAIELGLLDCAPCPACSAACAALLDGAREDRRNALAARARYRKRAARLQQRADARAARRATAAAPAARSDDPRATPAPALPPAAAAALARVKARMAGHDKP